MTDLAAKLEGVDPIKLWHDDVRPAPEGWEHARTNAIAKAWLKTGRVIEISMDHDLGYEGPLPGPCEECGGLGKWREGTIGGQTVGLEPRGTLWTCPACDGDGFIGGDILYIAGTAEETGYDLACWMAERGILPEKISIHSWNPGGAERMALALRQAGAEPVVKPYEIP